MAHRTKNLEDSSDSESMKDLNLDKDDEDIEFQEEKEIDDDEEENKNKEKNEIKKEKNKDLNSLFQKYPIIRKHARKISFKSSSSSSSDELDKTIKKDLAEILKKNNLKVKRNFLKKILIF